MFFYLMVWFVIFGVNINISMSSNYVQKSGGKIADKPEDLFEHCWCRSGQREIKLRFLDCMDYFKRWKSVTVEFDDNIDDRACGFILSSFTTVTLEPIFLRCNLCINMFPERKNTLRSSTEMMARYEKDDEIEKVLTMIWKDEYKDN